MNFPAYRSSVLPSMASLWALMQIIFFAQAALAGQPVPGERFFGDPDFSSKSAADQHWCRRVVESATPAIVPGLSSATSIVIYSLDPTHLDNIRPGVTDRKHFHGFPILGHATVSRPDELDHWRRTFIEGLIPCERVLCFAPRHGIRIHTPKATVDLVLCFECQKMRIFGGSVDTPRDECFFDAAVLNLLNAFLDAHQIERNIPTPE